MEMTRVDELTWWQKGVFYQIYPRSFADGNGDGIGDFYGMIERLDYLRELGIDAVWLSPHYPSPNADCGYDVADYVGVAPEYGTLDDFERFLDGAHQRGIRVILDLVLNHTSDQHPWFIESKSSRDNQKRDWYVWRDGKEGGPPNNWYSSFGGSAWEYDSVTEQYYYHYFLKEQPDLNWRNPAVKRALWDAVCFWLDRGVDGFRLDAIGTIFERPDFADQTAEFTQRELVQALHAAQTQEEQERLAEYWKIMFEYQLDQPGVHELMQELRALVDEYSDRMLVGESEDIAYYGDGTNELHLAFN
jgi:alpha-glucosidase